MKTLGPDAAIRGLSGGNVQRAVLGREPWSEGDLLIAANPCFGLDFAAVAEIRARIVQTRNAAPPFSWSARISTRSCSSPTASPSCSTARWRCRRLNLLKSIVPTVGRLLDVFRRNGLPVIHTRELAALPGEIVLDKPGKGAFYATPLGDILADRKITHLVFAGVTTEVCVQTTMREANDRGWECLLAEDATESYFPEFKTAAIDMIRAQSAIVGWTATVALIDTGLAQAQ